MSTTTTTTNPTKLPLRYFVLNPTGTTPDAVAARAAMLVYANGIRATEPVTAGLIDGWVAYLTPTAAATTTPATPSPAPAADKPVA